MSPHERAREFRRIRRRGALSTLLLAAAVAVALAGSAGTWAVIRDGQREGCRRGVADRKADIAQDHDIAAISRGEHVDDRAQARAASTARRLVSCDRTYSIVPRIG